MQVFLLLITKLLALYFLIAIGFIAGRALNVQKESIARILICILAPLVVLYGVWSAGVAWNVLSLPFLFLVVSIVLCLMARVAGKLLWRDATANLFAFTAATGNTGYFGIPVAWPFWAKRLQRSWPWRFWEPDSLKIRSDSTPLPAATLP